MPARIHLLRRKSSDQPDDLFGLKPGVTDTLARTLRPIKAQAFGWVMYSKIHASHYPGAFTEAALTGIGAFFLFRW
jgi:hypothetical protein